MSLVLQQPTEAGDHRDRRPQLVAHEMDELRALTSLQFELLLERDPVTGVFEAGDFRGASMQGSVRSTPGRRDRGQGRLGAFGEGRIVRALGFIGLGEAP